MCLTLMLKPFIKFTGSKFPLLAELHKSLPSDLSRYKNYCEPFVGAGAFALSLLDRDFNFILNDADSDLMALWKAVSWDHATMLKTYDALRVHYNTLSQPEQLAFYIAIRSLWNLGTRTPAINVFLRKTCFNGLWRVNSDGHMNTPWGKRQASKFESQDVHDALQSKRVTFTSLDFETRFNWRDVPTLYYVDPPYDGGFTQYTKDGFTDKAQIALLKTIAAAQTRGDYIVYSNADTSKIRALIETYWPASCISTVQVQRTISAKKKGRVKAPELIVRSVS